MPHNMASIVISRKIKFDITRSALMHYFEASVGETAIPHYDLIDARVFESEEVENGEMCTENMSEMRTFIFSNEDLVRKL